MLTQEITQEEIEELFNKHPILAEQKALTYIEQLENKVKEAEENRNELATILSKKEDDKQAVIDRLKEMLDSLGEQTRDNYLREKANYTIEYLVKILELIQKGE